METYVADGFRRAFEECLNQELGDDDATTAALKQGLDVVYKAAQERIDEHGGGSPSTPLRRVLRPCPRSCCRRSHRAGEPPVVLSGGQERVLDEQMCAAQARDCSESPRASTATREGLL